MKPQSLFDRTYQVILNTMIETGRAPHYTEVAAKLDLSVEEGRKAVHDLMALGIPGMWLFPETDYISSFAPFSNLPTQYRISVDWEQKWFGQ